MPMLRIHICIIGSSFAYLHYDHFGFANFSAIFFSARKITLLTADRFFANADFCFLRNCLLLTSSKIPDCLTVLVNRCTKFWEASLSFFLTSTGIVLVIECFSH